MAQELRLTLFGGFQLILDKQDITRSLSNKAQGLISYLAVQPKPHTRQHLAGLFWPEVAEENALRSLRVELAKIRPFLEPYLDISRVTIGWNTDAPYWLDVEAFEYLLKQSKLAEGEIERSWLREAVDLYEGEFLAGFIFDDVPEFQAWMLLRRESLKVSALDAFTNLVNVCIVQEEYPLGIEYARRLLALDSWREDAHRQLMWLYAQNGQRSDALMQYETCREILMQELGILPGEQTRKLHERILNMEDSPGREIRPLPELSQTPPMSDIPFLVPPAIPYFTGREQEVAALRTYLLQPSNSPRRYCLTGLGGIGKTSLANKMAHELRDAFPDGVLWANVAGGDLTAVAENWATAYGYDFTGLPDFNSQAAALRQLLEEKQALLIFDDVATAASIRPLLPQNAQSVVLFTTRQADQAHLLQAQVINIRELKPEDGRLLLNNILGVERVSAEPTAAHDICRLLHNHPLALSIAAHRLIFRPRRKLADLADQLRYETERLDLSRGDREVRASFALSWAGLDETQKRVFASSSVFQGRPFAAEALAALLEMNHYQIQDQLDTLAALSLLNHENDFYYRQHPLLADFAQEHLDSSEILYRRMVDYYLTYATTHQQSYLHLRPEWENLSVAIQQAHQMHLWRTVLDYTAVLRWAWFSRGRYTEARQAYQWGQQAAMNLEDEQALAHIFLHHGQACLEQNSYDEAHTLLSQSLQLYQELNDPNGQANARYQLARIAKVKAAYETAANHLSQALSLRKELGDMPGVSEIIFQQASLLHSWGRYKEAEPLAKQALDIQLSVSHKTGAIRTLRLLAETLLALDENAVEMAEQYSQQALTFCEELHDQVELAMTCIVLSGNHFLKKEFTLAQEYSERSLALLQKIGDQRAQAQVYYQLCRINRAQKEYLQALEWAEHSLHICQDLNDKPGLAFVWTLIGDLKDESGQSEQAISAWHQALVIAQEIEHLHLIQTLQRNLGLI